MPDESNNDPLLPDIPEQPAPQLPKIIEEEINPPNLALPLSDYQSAYRWYELERQRDRNRAERAMLSQRKAYAISLFVLSVLWLLFIAVFLWCAGKNWLGVSDAVLIALITTTTLNVLGLFYIVARWLFPQTHIEIKESKK
jgi:hypothetical protein